MIIPVLRHRKDRFRRKAGQPPPASAPHAAREYAR